MVKLNTDRVIHILRNPYGFDYATLREARLKACDEIEKWRHAYENLMEWCEINGLDTKTYSNS